MKGFNERLGNKGSLSIAVILVIVILSVLYMTLTYTKSENSKYSVMSVSDTSNELINDINSKERLLSLLNDNKSLVGEVFYEDLNRGFEVRTIDEITERKTVELFEAGSISFDVDNSTSLVIDIEGSNYDVKLMYDEKDVLNSQGLNLSGNKTITIDELQVYNPNSGETNYGTYEVILKGDANITLTYDKLVERTVEITGDNYERNILITDVYVEYID